MIQKKESMTVYSILKRYRSRFVSSSIVKHTLSDLIWKILEFHETGRDLKNLYRLVLMSKSRIEEAHKIFLRYFKPPVTVSWDLVRQKKLPSQYRSETQDQSTLHHKET